jgi:hypothetical protein
MEIKIMMFIICELSCGLLLIGTNFEFIANGVIDYKRKCLISKITNSLLNPTKSRQSSTLLLFPTVNFLDKKSLFAWLTIRTSLMDFGIKFSKRV